MVKFDMPNLVARWVSNSMIAPTPTPFELSLESEMHVESQRFNSEWLFKWHGMTYDGGVTDVDDFKGGRIRYSGIRFGHQQQQIFWQALARYLVQKTHEVFGRWDFATKDYSLAMRRRSIDGVERILTDFTRRIVAKAIDTDRRLRGEGDPSSVQPYNSSGSVHAITETSRLAIAHRALLDEAIAAANPPAKPALREPWVPSWPWFEQLYSENKGLIWFCGLVIGAGYSVWQVFFR